MLVYGNGNGIPWFMEVQYSYTYVNCVVSCHSNNRVGVRFIDNTHFAVITGSWDYVTVCADFSDFSVATSDTTYSIDQSSSYYPTASTVRDNNNNNAISFAYSKAGLNYTEYTWLAAWNGYELRGVNKSQFLTSHQEVGTITYKTGSWTVTSTSWSQNYPLLMSLTLKAGRTYMIMGELAFDVSTAGGLGTQLYGSSNSNIAFYNDEYQYASFSGYRRLQHIRFARNTGTHDATINVYLVGQQENATGTLTGKITAVLI